MSEKAYSMLADLEELSKKNASSLPSSVEIISTWSGVAFRMGNTKYVAPISEVSEVIPVPSFTIVPGVRNWVRGIANVRGRLLPIMDLTDFLGTGDSKKDVTSQRVLVVDKEEIYSGLMVDEVMGMQHFPVDGFTKSFESCGEAIDPYIGGAYVRDEEAWHLFNVFDLSEDPQFLHAAV